MSDSVATVLSISNFSVSAFHAIPTPPSVEYPAVTPPTDSARSSNVARFDVSAIP
jgi:hypothetical protein